MDKLLALYKTAPTDTNRARLQTYLRKHMMASCMLTVSDCAFLRANGFSL